MKKVYLAIFILLTGFSIAFADINLNISKSTMTILDDSSFKLNNVKGDIDGAAVDGQFWIDFRWDSKLLDFLPINAGVNDCQDDDVQNGIYRSCNYFPLETGNTWVYSLDDFAKTVTVSSDTHSFINGMGKRINYMSDPCASMDVFVNHSQNGFAVYGVYDREDKTYYEIPVQGLFIMLPKEMRFGDSWTLSTGAGSMTFNFIGLETVNVPAGTFSSSLKIKVDRVDDKGAYTTFFWYAKNVGIVKAQRTFESPTGYDGCILIDSEHPLMELQSAYINGISYP